MKTAMYPSPNIKCEGCANTIKGTLTPLPGVEDVQVDVESKRVKVTYDDALITDDQVKQKMAQAGFPAA